VTQVILIGDALPNTKAEVASKRKAYNWTGTPYEQPTHYQEEIAKLKAASPTTKVHCFFVDRYAESGFKEMAAATNGQAAFLDANGPNGAELLTDVVTSEVLRSVGGDEMVKLYQAKFVKGYKAN